MSIMRTQNQRNGLFSLPNTDSGTSSDSDYKPHGYIVLCRTCSHCTDSDSDSNLDSDLQLLLYPILGWISVPGLEYESVSGCKIKACLHVPSSSLCLFPSNLHCVNGDGPFDGENGFCAQSACQTVRFHWHSVKFDSDRHGHGSGDGMCKQALNHHFSHIQ